MLISDWSSDVCTSDLARRDPGDPARDGGAGPAVGAHGAFDAPRAIARTPVSRRELAAGRGGRGSVRADPGRPRDRQVAQIGRASSRQRVCQFVYISVDPLYLNTQLNKHNSQTS